MSTKSTKNTKYIIESCAYTSSNRRKLPSQSYANATYLTGYSPDEASPWTGSACGVKWTSAQRQTHPSSIIFEVLNSIIQDHSHTSSAYRVPEPVRGVARNLFWGGINFYCTILQSDILAAWRHRMQLVHKHNFQGLILGGYIYRYTPVATPLEPVNTAWVDELCSRVYIGIFFLSCVALIFLGDGL